MKKFSFHLLLFLSVAVQAQNNPIFTGGNADGWTNNAYAQSTNDIFKGGAGDGWSFSAYQQTSNDIFVGGIGDGWAFSSFLQAGNAIFNGNTGDGWSFSNFLQAGNSIFTGGQGDGWTSVYRPMGALPITLAAFTAEKSGTISLLQWQTTTEINTLLFEIERSSDAVQFVKIGSVSAAGNSTTPKDYLFTDVQPVLGTNYYRLRQVDRNGAFVYTPTRMVLFNNTSSSKLKVYPVPATAMLTIELPQELQNGNVVLNLSNALGVMVKQVKIYGNTSTRQVMNISTLPAGVYTLQVSGKQYNSTQAIIKQ